MAAVLDDLLDEDLRPLDAWDDEPSGFNYDLAQMLDPATLDGEALVTYIRRVEALQASLAARSHVAVARLCDLHPVDAPEILASALDETTTTAEHRTAASARLFRVHRGTLRRMDHGEVNPRHATVLERACRNLPAGVAMSVDDAVWSTVREADPAEVKRAAVALAVAIDPEAAAARATKERADRGVDVFPQPDGTGLIELKAPVEDCAAVSDALNDATATHDPSDRRTRQQRLADLMVLRLTGRAASLSGGFDDHLLAGAPSDSGGIGGTGGSTVRRRDRRIDVGVTIPLDVLLGVNEILSAAAVADGPPRGPGAQPRSERRPGRVCTVDGQAVADTVALALLRSDTAVLRRLVTDPLTGHLLDAHPGTYKPGAELARFVRRRDRECLWPGCHRRARACDLDHHDPHPRGPTSRGNVGPFCEPHHQLKHTEGWDFVRHPDGSAILTGPCGTVRPIEPWRVDGPIDRLPMPMSAPSADPAEAAPLEAPPVVEVPAWKLTAAVVIDPDDPLPF